MSRSLASVVVGLVAIGALVRPSSARADVVVDVNQTGANLAENQGACGASVAVGTQRDKRSHSSGSGISPYDETVTADVDFQGVHASSTCAQKTSLVTIGDTLKLESEASAACRRTLTGDTAIDGGTFVSGLECCRLHFTVAQRSTFVLTCEMDSRRSRRTASRPAKRST